MQDRDSGRVKAQVTPHTSRATLGEFVDSGAMPGARLCTDDWAGHIGVRNRHRVVEHSIGEYVNDMVQINGVESFWALLKRGYYGTYHQMSAKHLDHYVRELSGHHNARPVETIDQLKLIVQGMVGKRLRNEDLIG